MILKNVRADFLSIFAARQYKGQGTPKYSVTVIVPRDHPQLNELQAGMVEAAAAKWGAKAQETLAALKAGDRLAVHDGDAKQGREEYKGKLFVNASNDRPFLILGSGPDGRGPVSETDGKFYNGCRVNIGLSFWAQDNDFGRRINCTLTGIQFAGDDERIKGGTQLASVDDFEPIANAAPAGAPAGAAPAGSSVSSLF